MFLQENIRLITFFLSSAFFFFLESYRPLRSLKENRWQHLLKNASIAFVNALIYGLFFTTAINLVTNFTTEHTFGVFQWLELPVVFEFSLSFLALDFILYLWHVAAHKVPFIWKFHLVHHVDSDMDFSTGTRFHLGEMIGIILFHLPFYWILGISLEALIIYQVLLILFDQFGHANYRVPAGIDRVLRWVFVTSNYHRVHHSDHVKELNSNYGTVFSIWDRIWKTYNPRKDLGSLTMGIKGYPKILSWWALNKLPFMKKQP
ncbi:MAG: sterol desaturase family protein [Candidatus Altimarinota bacterium]